MIVNRSVVYKRKAFKINTSWKSAISIYGIDKENHITKNNIIKKQTLDGKVKTWKIKSRNFKQINKKR